jgi:surfactin synthase thioesterase subunit
MENSLWYRKKSLDSAARMRLICLPHAGGGGAVYHRWARHFPEWIGVLPIELPGRDSRTNELPCEKLVELATELAHALLAMIQDRSFAIFGHSMGAAIGFELARRLQIDHGREPTHLFVSSCRAPRAIKAESPLHALETDAMIDHLLDRYGTRHHTSPDELSLMRFLAPTLRADLKMMETYAYQTESLLQCPITALGGITDPGVARHELEAWRMETTGAFSCRLFPGGHFYLRDQEMTVVRLMQSKLG